MFDQRYFNNEFNQKIDIFIQELLKWNKKTDLIGNSTRNNIYTRHIINSLQLMPFLKKQDHTIMDIGTGAGFPGIICAIYDPNRQYILFEKKTQKQVFLKNICTLLRLKNVIIKGEFKDDALSIHADILTSRALLPISFLKKLSPLVKKIILFKGENYKDEIGVLNKSFIADKVKIIKGYDPHSYFIQY